MSINNHNAPYNLRGTGHAGPSTERRQTQPAVPDPNERPHSVPIGSLRPQRVVSIITDIIKQYDHGDVSKTFAIARITSALEFTAERDPAKEQALQSYLEQLDQIDHVQHRAHTGSSNTFTARGQDNRSPAPSAVPSQSDLDSQLGGSGSKHDRHPFQYDPDYPSDDGGSSGDGSSDDDETKPSRKRPKLDESEMPWYKEEARGRRSGRESCVQSSQMLRTYGRDISKVKQWILTSTVAPTGFPPSEWENLLRGKPLNLDVIFSSLFHVLPVKENRGRIGDNEISLGYTEPSRKVQNVGDWTVAWNIAARATEFLFRHRREELQSYGEYIQGEFSARRPEAHFRVLRLDQSIRNEVGGGTSVLLTDFDRFDKHRSAILSSDGLFALQDQRAPGRSRTIELCHRFNSERGCPNTTSSCRYRHVCRRCGRGGHGEGACEAKK